MAEELYHHGIKGQKWGVRRTRAELNRIQGRNQHAYEVAERFKNHKETDDDKKYVRNLSEKAGKHFEKYDKLTSEFKNQKKYKTYSEFIYSKNPNVRKYIDSYNKDEEKYRENVERMVNGELGQLKIQNISFAYKDSNGTHRTGTANAANVLSNAVSQASYDRIKYAQQPSVAMYEYDYGTYIKNIKSGKYAKSH